MAAPVKHVPKQGKLVCEKSSFKNEKSRHKKVVEEHYFNYAVSIVIPGCDRVPDIVTSPLCGEKAYMVPNLPVTRLIDKEFIEAFVKKGAVYMITHRTHIDSEDCAALLPSGQLILNLTKDTYELLGLEGKPSIHGGKKPGKYVVTLDLTPTYFTPGKKNYQRVRTCLEENFLLYFDFLVLWTPTEPSICASSIAWYFERKGFTYQELNMKETCKSHRECEVPVIDSCVTETTADSCGLTDLYEWLGYISCNCNIAGGSEEYLSCYSCPFPSRQHLLCACYRIEGIFSASSIHNLLDRLRDYVNSESSSIPWAAVTCHGFADSPVSWKTREHGFSTSGDNLYTYVIFANDDYWLFSAIDAMDICP